MPELPEVETMRRGLLPVLGCRIQSAVLPHCTKRPISIRPAWEEFCRRITGQEIVRLERVGKRVVVVLNSEDRLIFEPRMTGLVLLADPPTTEHLRLKLELSEPTASLMYWDRRGLGSVHLLSSDEFASEFCSTRFGPDALQMTPDLWPLRFGTSRQEIKPALLDQKRVLGIGNLYASEILFLAQIHPQRQCMELKSAEWTTLHKATQEVLETAILHEGSTLSDGTYRNALNQAGSYQNQHRVYDREGLLCLRCGKSNIQRMVQAQRSTFFCPTCQPLGKKRK